MARRRKAQLAINHERWLVSYADFITLLFAFFVVMYSVSQVSETKYRVLSDTLVSTFKFQSQTLNPIQVGEPSLSSDPSVIENSKPKLGEGTGEGAFEKEVDLPHMAEILSQSLADLIDKELVSINSNEFWLEITLNSNVLFSSASATPSADARLIFAEIASHMHDGSNPIQVEGYTDTDPIRTPNFPSNWELSSARASAVVKLLAAKGVSPERLSAVGYGEFQPIADNSTEAGRAQNRRVVLMVAREKPNRPSRQLEAGVEKALDENVFIELRAEPQTGGQEEGSFDDVMLFDDSAQDVIPALNPQARENKPATELPKPVTTGGLRAIKLESGGILYTSDPSRTAEQPEE